MPAPPRRGMQQCWNCSVDGKTTKEIKTAREGTGPRRKASAQPVPIFLSFLVFGPQGSRFAQNYFAGRYFAESGAVAAFDLLQRFKQMVVCVCFKFF